MSEKKRFKSFAAIFLVLMRGREILLLRRANTGYQDGNYSLVAGHLEGGETVKQGIIREAKEEANIDMNLEDLEVVHVMHRYRPAREYFDVYLRAEKWSGEIFNKEPDKCDELKWFDVSKLPDNMVPEIRQALEKIGNNIHYSEIGWDNK